MTPVSNPYGKIPEFFREQCELLRLPLDAVVFDTAGFVSAILALPDSVDQVRMHLYIDSDGSGYNYLHCFLQVLGGCSPAEAGRVGKTVLKSLQEAGIPRNYRDVRIKK